LVHVEEVAVPAANDRDANTCDRVGEIEVDGETAIANTPAFITNGLRVARGHVAGHEVAKARITALEIVVALRFRNLFGRSSISLSFRHPHADVVSKALAHQCQLRLM